MSAADVVALATWARVPALLWGSPGIGKTEIIEQIAKTLNMGFVAQSAGTAHHEDAGGLPIAPKEPGAGVRREPLFWFTELNRLAAKKESRGAIGFIDEISSAPPPVRAAFLSLIQSRYCGDYKVNDKVCWLGAANPTSMAANGWDLDAATISRWTHLSWDGPSPAEFADYLGGGKGLALSQEIINRVSKPFEEAWNGEDGAWARGLVAGYVQHVPDGLNSEHVPPDSRGVPTPYACPRTWENLAKLLTAARGNEEAMMALTFGTIGRGTGEQFLAWIDTLDLPSPIAVLRDPKILKLDKDRPDQANTIFEGLLDTLRRAPTLDHYRNMLTALLTIATAGFAGVAARGASRVANLDEVKKHGAVQEWLPLKAVLHGSTKIGALN